MICMSAVITEDRVDKAADTLARAMFHYPFPGGAISDDDRRTHYLSALYSLELTRVLSFGEISTVVDSYKFCFFFERISLFFVG